MPETTRPRHVSPVFIELDQYIKQHYPALGPDVQRTLFAFAYAEYTHEKKQFITREVFEGKTAADLKQCFQPYRGDINYKRYCESALKRSNDMQEHTKTRVIKAIAGTVVTALQSTKPTGLRKVTHFAWESILHALHIVLAAVIIYLVAGFLIWISPYVPLLSDIGKHYIQPVIDAAQGQAERSREQTPDGH